MISTHKKGVFRVHLFGHSARPIATYKTFDGAAKACDTLQDLTGVMFWVSEAAL